MDIRDFFQSPSAHRREVGDGEENEDDTKMQQDPDGLEEIWEEEEHQTDLLQGEAAGSDLSDRRQYLHRILTVTIFLAKQGIPFHGHEEQDSSGHNEGNFAECMKLLKKFDPF